MKGLVFDIETNGFLDTVSKIHCIAYHDLEEGITRSVGGPTDEHIRNLLTHLEDAPELVGHNILEFDIPVLQKIYPTFKPRGRKWDTLLDSQFMYTDLRDLDYQYNRMTNRNGKTPLPANLMGAHKLEAWGYRLGVAKGTFGVDADWAVWSQAMQDYCEQDVTLTARLAAMLRNSPRWCQAAHDCEMEFKEFMLDQEREGFPFDVEAAKRFYVELAAERATIEEQLKPLFKPWIATTDFTPKRDNAKRGYTAGVVFKKEKLIQFNPRSHRHIAERLIVERGWKPEAFTDKGQPCTDADVLVALGDQWPECKLLAEHAEIQKVIGMVAEGKTSYLKMVSEDGRIRGKVGTCTTVTGRCNHKEPNLGNVPRRGKLGHRVRQLFVAPPGYGLVGGDAKGLELRCMGHFLAKLDKGEYARVVVDGDPHEFHRLAADLAERDDAKTFIYGFIYGAGDAKIGLIVHKGQAAGRALRLKFLRRFPALAKLKELVSGKAKITGAINGLDGRRLHVRAAYSSLNTLLQSAGALVMKMAVIFFNREIRARGWYQAGLVRQVGFIHDEIQSIVRLDANLIEEVKQLKIESIRKAGEHFSFRCPTDGDAKSGKDWDETH